MGKHLFKLGLRRCGICKETKTIESFYKSNRGNGYRYNCKDCTVASLQKLKRNGRRDVLDRLGLKCTKCGIEHDNYSFFDIDHVVAIRQGRGHRNYRISQLENYMVLCPNCHRLKTIAEDGFK